MVTAMEVLDVCQGLADEYDEEVSDAALDLLRLFTRAKQLVAGSSAKQPVGADRLRAMNRMRSQLAESIIDDCLLFDERTVYALFHFLSAWRGAAYGHQSTPAVVVDAAFERAYRQVFEMLGPYARPALRESSTICTEQFS